MKSRLDAPEQTQHLGHFSFFINTRLLGTVSWLAERMNDFIAILHSTPPADLAAPVLVPGEIEFTNMARQQKDGISIEKELLAMLEEHAAKA